MKKPKIETEVAMETFTKKKLIDDLKEVVNDAEELLKKAAFDQTREWVATAQAKAKKSLAAANDWLAEEEGALTAKARSTAKAAEDYVQANTWKILGMAAMAGVVVGILAVRRGLPFLEPGKRPVHPGAGTTGDRKRMKDQQENKTPEGGI
jgi:ElaB/YqjD/DUF883 family membrane-anchored ribosome-binding protein